MDVNDPDYDLQKEVDKILKDGYDVITHTRVRGKLWDEDIIIGKKP